MRRKSAASGVPQNLLCDKAEAVQNGSMLETQGDGSVCVREDGPVHEYFELTYASYKVLPRTLMQSMPIKWQERFVALMREMEDAYSHVSASFPGEYAVTPKKNGKFCKETIPHYRRGRVEPNI